MGAVGLFLVTSLVGRVWCGYTCPQTVWTDLFMWVERVLEGDRNERMQRDAASGCMPIRSGESGSSTRSGSASPSGPAAPGSCTTSTPPPSPSNSGPAPASSQVYFFTGLFTLTTYVLAGWAREQVCTYMCPWPRFQSAMLDDQSFTVTYQAWRGEPRGPRQAP